MVIKYKIGKEVSAGDCEGPAPGVPRVLLPDGEVRLLHRLLCHSSSLLFFLASASHLLVSLIHGLD